MGSVEFTTQSPTARAPIARAPTGGRQRARRVVRAPRGQWEGRSPWGERCRQGPISRAGGTAARPPAGGLRRRQPRRGNHRGWPVRRCWRRLPPHAPPAIGIPPVVPRGDMALVGDVDQHPRQKLQRLHGLSTRRWPFGLVRPVRHRLGGSVVGEPLQRDGIPRAVARQARLERAIVVWDPFGRTGCANRSAPGPSAPNDPSTGCFAPATRACAATTPGQTCHLRATRTSRVPERQSLARHK